MVRDGQDQRRFLSPGRSKPIERDLRPGRERIKLDFIELPAIKHVYVETLTICNTVGDVVSVKQVNCWLSPRRYRETLLFL